MIQTRGAVLRECNVHVILALQPYGWNTGIFLYPRRGMLSCRKSALVISALQPYC